MSMKLYQLNPGKTMLQIKKPLICNQFQIDFIVVPFATPNISSKNFKIIHHPFVVKKEFGCYNESVKCNFTVTTLIYYYV